MKRILFATAVWLFGCAGALAQSMTIQYPISTGTLGTSAGRTVFTNGSEPFVFNSLFFNLTSTATAGNRDIVVKVLDASNNVVLQNGASAVQPASQVGSYLAAPGITSATPSGEFNISMATMTYLPAGGKIVVVDIANIDVNDTITSGQLVYSSRF